MAEPLLALNDLRAGYGDAVILEGVSLAIPERGSLAVLGRNGVGKSTLLLTIMGFSRLHSGRILWKGQDISSLPSHKRALLGLGWVAQEREIFPSLTVEENLTVAARAGPWDVKKVYGLFPRLQERRASMGNQLSGGEQQMLAIARALMTNPGLLLLDEPLEGLAPIVVHELASSLAKMMQEGMAAILVEQHTEVALSLTAEVLVIERGTIAHRARSADFARDSVALERYVGLSGADSR